MNFSDCIDKNRLSLFSEAVDVDQLIGFLQENTHITQLSVAGCNLKSRGAEALANGNLQNLTTLNLEHNNIGHQGAEALAKSENLENLIILNLGGNNIGHQGAEALAKSENFENLVMLNLRANNIGHQGAEALANGNLQNLTNLNLECNNIGHQGAEALAKSENIENLIMLNLGGNNIGHQGAEALANGNLKNIIRLCLGSNIDEYVKALAESGKNTKLYTKLYNDFYDVLKEAWSKVRKGSNGNVSKLDESVTKKLFFDTAREDNNGKRIELLLNDPDKYPFLINSKNEEGHTLSYFYYHSPKMQKFFFERGMIPEKRNQRREDERIAQDSQSVHASPVVKRTNFFAKKLVESIKVSKEQLKQAADSYVKSIELLKQYQNDPIRLKLLSLSNSEKRSVMKKTLPSGSPIPNDEEFIKVVIDKAEQALKDQYLRKNSQGEYDKGYTTNRMQYDYARDNAKITIPESIGYIKLLINNFFVPLEERKELLVSLMEQNPELVKEKLPIIRKELGNIDILSTERFEKPELHGLLNSIDDSKKIDKLFKEISSLDIEKVWKEQKEFVLLKQIYISATTYGEDNSACIQGTWSQIINGINEISTEILAQYDHYLEEERKLEVQKDVMTKENIKPFLESLADRLIQYVENNPELKEVLQHHLLYVEHIDINNPEGVTFEQQKILAEINKYFSENIKGVLRNYNKTIPSNVEYGLIINGLSTIKAMQDFVQDAVIYCCNSPSSLLKDSNAEAAVNQITV